MKEKTLTIINKLGLHARASMKLVDTASRFQSDTKIIIDGQQADAKDILQTMSLGAAQGTQITIQVNGNDEDRSLQAIEDLINNYFGEGG
jgi:phosphocarrier protein HPr